MSREGGAGTVGETGSSPAHRWDSAGDDARKHPSVFLLQCLVLSSETISQVAHTDVKYWLEPQWL